MPLFKFGNININAMAGAVPTKVVRNADYESNFEPETIKKIIDMTGVRERRVAHSLQTASDLGYAAATNLLTRTNIDREEIGLLIFGSNSGDYRRPATACVLQKRLGLSNDCAVFDVGLGCSAFCYCVAVAASMLQCSQIKKALVVVGETVSKLANQNDKSSALLLGDGGSAVLLEKAENDSEKDGIRALLRSYGDKYKAIIVPAGGFRNMYASDEPMIWGDGNTRTLYDININGIDVFNFAISDVKKAIMDFWQQTGTKVDDYDCFAIHQANQFIQKTLAKKLNMPEDKMPISIDKYGNTSGPSIPLTLCNTYGDSNENAVKNVLMCGFGVGLSCGVVSAQINTKDIYPVIETDDYFAEGIINSPEDLEKVN